MDKTVQIKVEEIFVAEGPLGGTRLQETTAAVGEMLLKQVQNHIPERQLGCDKVDVSLKIVFNEDEEIVSFRYDIKRAMRVSLKDRVLDSLRYFEKSPFGTDETREAAGKWLAKPWS